MNELLEVFVKSAAGYVVAAALVFVGICILKLSKRLEAMGEKVVVTSHVSVEPRVVKVDIPVEKAPRSLEAERFDAERRIRAETLEWLRSEIEDYDEPPVDLINMMNRLLFDKPVETIDLRIPTYREMVNGSKPEVSNGRPG